jgi:hypothetical protein
MYDPSKFETHGQLNLIKGVMKVVVPVSEIGATKQFNIKTSTAIMGVRGTEFIVVSGENFSVVYGTKGRVCIKSLKESGKFSVRRVPPGTPAEKDEVCLDPGMMSVILKGQPPTTPTEASAQVISQAEGLLSVGISDAPGSCVLGTLPGVDLVNVANNLMAQGANLQDVQASLTDVCYVGAESYAYSPEGPPAIPPGPPPTFPGGGGGGGGVPPGVPPGAGHASPWK